MLQWFIRFPEFAEFNEFMQSQQLITLQVWLDHKRHAGAIQDTRQFSVRRDITLHTDNKGAGGREGSMKMGLQISHRDVWFHVVINHGWHAPMLILGLIMCATTLIIQEGLSVEDQPLAFQQVWGSLFGKVQVNKFGHVPGQGQGCPCMVRVGQGVSAQGPKLGRQGRMLVVVDMETQHVDRQNYWLTDQHDWKHYLSTTSLAGGNQHIFLLRWYALFQIFSKYMRLKIFQILTDPFHEKKKQMLLARALKIMHN